MITQNPTSLINNDGTSLNVPNGVLEGLRAMNVQYYDESNKKSTNKC